MTDLSNGAAWMKGRIIPVSEATISVMDWGFTHSDVTYDVAQVWDGAFFRLDDHLDRFEDSLAKFRITIPETRAEVRDILHRITAASGLRHAYCAFVASRGLQMVPGSRDPRTCASHFFAWVVPYVHVIAEDVVARGARLKIAEGAERISPRAVDPTAKNYHWGDITAGLFEALDAGYDSVLLADADGNVTEGPGFNAFAVIDGTVVTAAAGVLEGITRKTVLEICAALGLPAEIRAVPVAEFLDADEVFLSSSGGGPIPIVQVNDRIYGNGAPGPVTCRLRDTYRDWRAAGPLVSPIDYGDG
jgi:branched-chain amino acid aminotransferase